MCFIAILMLRRIINVDTFVDILRNLGYSVLVREAGGRYVLEARRNKVKMKTLLNRDILKIETEDYGPNCIRDLDELYKALYEDDLQPEVIEIISPYIFAYEKKRMKTKKLFDRLGIETEEVYSGYCG